MNRSEAKELLPIIQAFAEGKGVETKTGSGWISIENMSFAGNPDSYRIKPEPEYRPFENTVWANGVCAFCLKNITLEASCTTPLGVMLDYYNNYRVLGSIYDSKLKEKKNIKDK